MGLSIPSSFIQSGSTWKNKLKGLGEDELARTHLYVNGPVEADELLRDIFQSRGLTWSLHNGKFGPVSIMNEDSQYDIDVILTPENYVGEPLAPGSGWPKSKVRKLGEIDKIKIRTGFNIIDNDFEQTTEVDSLDGGAWYRPRTVTYSVRDRGLPQSGWEVRWQELAQDIANFWAARNFEVELTVERLRGQQIWPGTVILLTDSRLVSPSGTYGISVAAALVTSVERNLAQGQHRITALIFESGLWDSRYFAPMARVRGFDFDNNRLHVFDDFTEIGDGHLDVQYFGEPTWSPFGGSALLKVYEWDRGTWSAVGNLTVSTINQEAGNSYIVTTGAPGFKFNRDTDKIVTMAPSTEQTADWVIGIHVPTAGETGTILGGKVTKAFIS